MKKAGGDMTGQKVTTMVGVLAVALRQLLASAAVVVSTLVGTAAATDTAPGYQPPAPAGAYGVGYLRTVLVDESRGEPRTETADDHRELPVQVWYPAVVPAGAEALPFIPNPAQAIHMMTASLGLPPEELAHLKSIKGHAYAGAPVAVAKGDSDKFPVLVYSHAFGLFSAENSQLMEHLASNGYVVFAIDHPYQAAWAELTDGKTAAFDPTGFRDPEMTPEKGAALEDTMARMLNADNYESYLPLARQFILGQETYDRGIDLWIDDTAFVIDQLEAKSIPAFKPLYDVMNMEKLGVFGMSYGGATAGMTCLRDSRCKAGINMVGAQYGHHDMKFPITVPFMMMNSDQNYYIGQPERGIPVNFEANDFVFHEARGPVYSMTVGGAKPMSFSDLAHLMPTDKRAAFFGSVSPDAMNAIMNEYIRAFFDRYLKGRTAALLDGTGTEHPAIIEFIHRNEGGTAAP